MQRFDNPYIADWFATSLRWMMVVGLVVSLGLAGNLQIARAWPLGALIAWNLFMTILAGLNMRLVFHRRIGLAVDILLGVAFFWVQGSLRGPVFWAGVLPILTGAIYFELSGGLLSAIVFAALILYAGIKDGGSLQLALPATVIMAVLGPLFGLLGRALMQRVRHNRGIWLDEEDRRRRIQTERLRVIYEHTAQLSANLSYKRVLESALGLGATALNPESGDGTGDRLAGAVLLFKGGKLHLGSARRFTTADMRATFDGAEGILRRVFDTGEPVLSRSIADDPELGRIIALRTCTACYCFPLRSGLNVYGALLFAHPEADYFSQDRREILDILGRQAVVAIQNASLYQDLVQDRERIIEVHEEARKKLARDLHDGPTQSIAALAMRLNLVRRMIVQDAGAAAQELARIEDMAQRTSQEMRHMLFTLRPLVLESQGLGPALQAMAEKVLEVYGQQVLVNVDERVAEDLDLNKRGLVFYIIEEAVNNARKHAAATEIVVRLAAAEAGIALVEVRDNGVGFDVRAVRRAYDERTSSSLGLVNLQERTELANGALQIDSAPSRGTSVRVFIPLNDEAAERLHNGRK